MLGEAIEVAGTPYSLHYSSERVPDHTASDGLRIPLSGASVPASLLRIELEIDVAGRHFSQSFSNAANQDYLFTWDQRDAYGRRLQGKRDVGVRIGYVYAGVYQTTERFGYNGKGAISGDRSRGEVTIWKSWSTTIGHVELRPRGLGGWSLEVQHAYDPSGQLLYLGDGGRRGSTTLGAVATTLASGMSLGGLAVAPDGAIYYADTRTHSVWRHDENGSVRIAGWGGEQGAGFSGDGGSAADARLYSPMDVALGPDGSLYIADTYNKRVRRVGPDGIITTVAGGGSQMASSSPDGQLATALSFGLITGIAVAPDGRVYLAEKYNGIVYQLDLDGRISRFAGGGSGAYLGDGGPARNASLYQPNDIALGPDGSLYIADTGNNRIRRVGPDGVMTTVAGIGPSGYQGGRSSGDGQLATSVRLLNPSGVAVAADGSIYIAEYRRVRVVGADGIISSVVGRADGQVFPPPAGALALQTGLDELRGLDVGPDGSLYLAVGYRWEPGRSSPRLLQVAPIMPGFSTHDLAIPSSDGTQLYQFDTAGRHLRTLDALTGVALYTFTYDFAGRLESIADRDSLVTRIERDAAGNPLAIIAPRGQRTSLSLDSTGYLATIANPAGEATRFIYSGGGLLARLVTPRGGVHSFSYDQGGRLVRDASAGGGFTTLARVDYSGGYTVTLTNALGDASILAVENLPTGDHRRLNIAPNGATTSALTRPDGTQESTDAQGNITTIVSDADPRWGWLVPLATSITIKTAAGQAYYSQAHSRSVVLDSAGDTPALRSQADTITTNGRVSTTVYDGDAHTITTTDPAGKRTVMTIDARGRMVAEQTTNLALRRYAYDQQGQLLSVTEGEDAQARTTRLSYTSAGELASSIDPLGGVTSFAYDAAGRVIRQQLPTGQALDYSYDPAGNRIGSTDAQGIPTAFEYDLQDRLIAQTRDPGGRAVRTEYRYDVADNLLTRIEDSGPGRLNVTTQYAYTPIGAGYALSRVTNALGQASQLSYTPSGALRSASDPLGRTSVMTYTAQGWLAEVSTPGGRVTRTSYDAEGRPISTTNPRGGVTASSYDWLGRLQSLTAGAADVDGQPALNQTTSYDYDINGRVVRTTDPAGQVSLRSYDLFGRPATATDPLGNTTSFVYDAMDRVILQTAGANAPAEAQQIAYTYDASGRLLSERSDPDGLNLLTQYRYSRAGSSDSWSLQEVVDPRGHITAFHYNSLGQRDQTTDALGQTWRFESDNLGRLLRQIDPLGHAVSYTNDALGRLTSLSEDGRSEQSAYNADGTLASSTDFAGRLTRFNYDIDSRLLGIDYPAGTADVAYSYDANGNLVAMSDGLGATSYAYDALDRMRQRTRDGRSVTYSYDANNQTTQIDYWGQGAVEYRYDGAGRVSSLAPWGAAATRYSYDAIGRLSEQTRGNGVSTSYSYDSAGRLIGMLHALGASNIQTIAYALDANGNRTLMADADGATSYSYDALNRLSDVDYPAIAGGPGVGSTHYRLDELGNRLGDGATSYQYDAANRISSAGYSYDANGNLLSDGTTSYEYDAANRLIKSVRGGVTTTYGYDGNGNLVRQAVGGLTTDFVLDERGALPLILGELRSDGTELRYAYGPDGVSAQQTISGTQQALAYPLLDGLGSLRQLTDASGGLTLSRSYDAFGEIRHAAGAGWSPLGFTGERMGEADGTLYLRAPLQPGAGPLPPARYLCRHSRAPAVAEPLCICGGQPRYADRPERALHRLPLG